ncbi:MAG TPA: SurA N-terminal domain-containing protein [Pseudomonadales bacterium]|jgi:peptidyl-prolyl cis-trans isomerase D
MLQKLRDQTQSFGFKVLAGVMIFVLAVFGFGAFNLFVNSDPEVASVNGEEITQSELLVAMEREQGRIAAQFGEGFDPSLIDGARLQAAVLDQLIARQLLGQAVDELGFGVSQSRVDEAVTANPAFQVDGRFDAELYKRRVRQLRYTPQQFHRETGALMALEQLRRGLTETAFLTDWEVRQSARLLSQKRDIAYLAFTEDDFLPLVEVSDEEVATRYAENELEYRTEETVDVEYLELSAEGLVNDESISVSEAAIEETYAADSAEALSGDRRQARHILLEVGASRTAEQAENELNAVRERIVGGADFASLAEELSEDPGSAALGGDLGMVAKGIFDPAFEQALWELEVGEISEPVRTDFGYHLIQLDAVDVRELPPLSEQRDDIELRLRREQAEELFSERLREFDNLAFEQPDGLEGIAAALALETQSVAGVSRSRGDGVFANASLRDAVFASEVLDNGYNTQAVALTDNRAVVARVKARYEPEAIPLDDVRDDIRAAIASEKARVALRQAQQNALARVRSGESVSAVADDYGLGWQTFELVSRSSADAPRAVLSAAFSLPRPGEREKSVGEATLDDGSVAVVTVTRVVDGDVSVMAEREIESMRGFLGNRVASLDFAGLTTTLEREASISTP